MTDDINEYIDDAYEFEDENLEEPVTEIKRENLPYAAQRWAKDCLNVSHGNDIPAEISFFVLLGQVVKDFIRIPNGTNTEDTRIHFCWIQTSGTGKSTIWNFLKPITDGVNERINGFEGTTQGAITIEEEGRTMTVPKYDIFSITEYTDAALIGYYEKVEDVDGMPSPSIRHAGALEGSGLAHWDEFESSGIFAQTTHKQNAVVYLQTFMNTLEGENWIIKKKLKEGDIMECRCERSVFATTYVPKHLKDVIAEKGVLQRMLCYVRAVPSADQDKMRRMQLSRAGKREDNSIPSAIHADTIFTIYKKVKEQFIANGSNPFNTVKYSRYWAGALELEYDRMLNRSADCPPYVRETAENFMTRMLKILQKLSVLCCIASPPTINGGEEHYIVGPKHVRQAYKLTQQCYNTLVDWLELSLKGGGVPLAQQKKELIWAKVIKGMETDAEGYVLKSALTSEVLKTKVVGKSQAYTYFNKVKHLFDIDRNRLKLKQAKGFGK
jgi:hypothetical protein